jgi:hypothetical protein
MSQPSVPTDPDDPDPLATPSNCCALLLSIWDTGMLGFVDAVPLEKRDIARIGAAKDGSDVVKSAQRCLHLRSARGCRINSRTALGSGYRSHKGPHGSRYLRALHILRKDKARIHKAIDPRFLLGSPP